MNQRTKHFQLRLTPDEANRLKEKAASYPSVSCYIRIALKEYSDVNAKQRLELINDLGAFYRKLQNELSWAGGNLNRSVKRANELSPRSPITRYHGHTKDLERDKTGTICRNKKSHQTLGFQLLEP